jgi:hypothetical protein
LPTGACQTDTELTSVIDAWDRLPDAIRTGTVALVKVATK